MAWKQLEMELRGTTGKQLGNTETPQLPSVRFQSPPTSQILNPPSPLSLALPPDSRGPSTSISQLSFPRVLVTQCSSPGLFATEGPEIL